MAAAFVIDGVRRSVQRGDLQVSMSASARSTMTGHLYIPGATWRPSLGEEVALWTDTSVIGGARSFNGSTSVAYRAYSDTTVNNFTYGVWVRARSAANNQIPFHIGNGTVGYGFLTGNTGYWLAHYQGAVSIGGTSAAIALDTWQFLAARRSAGTTQLFLDGVPVGSTSGTAPSGPSGTSYWSAGARYTGSVELPFDGDVAWMFWTNNVLTDTEISQIAAGGPAGTGRSPDTFDPGNFFRTYALRGDATETDTDGGNALTLVGTTAITDGPLVISSGADVVFAGTLEDIEEAGAMDDPVDDLMVSFAASDFNSLPDRVTQSAAFSAQTLKERLDYIVSAHAVMLACTVAADQPTGPSLEARPVQIRKLREHFSEISEESGGYVLNIDAFKVLSMRLPSAVAAPFDIDEASKYVRGDLRVRSRLTGDYCNFFRTYYGTGTRIFTEVFTGDGATDEWQLTRPFSSVAPGAEAGTVLVNGATVETMSVDDTGGAWELDTSTSTLTRVAGNLTNGHTVAITYIVAYPHEVTTQIDTAAWDVVGIHGDAMLLPEVFDYDTALGIAEDVFARRSRLLKVVQYQTTQPGLRPGQIQHIEIADRDVDDDCVITEVQATAFGAAGLVYDVTASTDGVPNDWRAAWKRLAA